MKSISGKAFARILERHGWQLRSIRGSHHSYGKEGRRERITVPVHGNRDLKEGLLRHLMKIAGLTDDDLR
jgi:Predicted periplasmic or secreted lipoprotein